MTAEMSVAGTASTGLPEDHAPAQPLSLLRVLDQEFTELHAGDPGIADSAPPADMLELYQRIHGLTVPRAALGGIRSASFALGVLQGLASHGLLRHFHHLSTVSGGGYIGSWLSAWRFHQRNDEAVFNALAKRSGYPVGRDETFVEPAELQQLRANSNFLTPRLGAFSADTWTGVALYIRNFLLNWFIFAPLFLGLLLIPHAAFDVLICGQIAIRHRVTWILLDCEEQFWHRLIESASQEMRLPDYGQRRANPGVRAQSQRVLDMLNRNVGLARLQSEDPADVPTARETGVEREGAVDQRHLGAASRRAGLSPRALP